MGENVSTAQMVMDCGTVDTVQPANSMGDSSDDDDHTENNKCEVLPANSAVDIHSVFSSVCCYLEAYSNGEVFKHIDQLE
jgi:hypothetical protein